MKTTVISQFAYWSYVWMCHSGQLNNYVNAIHWRSIGKPFEKQKSVTNHKTNTFRYLVEIFKVKTEQSLKIMNSIFEFRKNNYDLISKSHVKRVNMRTVAYKTGSLRCGIARL